MPTDYSFRTLARPVQAERVLMHTWCMVLADGATLSFLPFYLGTATTAELGLLVHIIRTRAAAFQLSRLSTAERHLM